MKKLKILGGALIILGSITISGWCYTQREQIQNTQNKNRDSIEKSFPNSLIALTIDSNGAHLRIKPDGQKFVLGDPKIMDSYGFSFNFTLNHAGQMFFSPGHHGSSTYTVKEIRPDRIVLHYTTNFDLRSFGKNIRSSDQGDFTVVATEATEK